MDDRGQFGGESPFECWKKLRCFFDSFAVAAKYARVSREIGVLKIGSDRPAWKLAFLMHPDGAVHAIVDQYNDNRQPILNGGRKLLAIHQEISIASKADDDTLGKNTRCPYCRRQAKAHRAGGGP